METMAAIKGLMKLKELRIVLPLADEMWGAQFQIELQTPFPLLQCKLRALEIQLPWYYDPCHVVKVRSLLDQQDSLTSLDLTLDGSQRWDICETAIKRSASTIQRLTLGVSDQEENRFPINNIMLWETEARPFDWNVLLGSKMLSLELLVHDELRRTLRTKNFAGFELKYI
jgi:hypothetical protein